MPPQLPKPQLGNGPPFGRACTWLRSWLLAKLERIEAPFATPLPRPSQHTTGTQQQQHATHTPPAAHTHHNTPPHARACHGERAARERRHDHLLLAVSLPSPPTPPPPPRACGLGWGGWVRACTAVADRAPRPRSVCPCAPTHPGTRVAVHAVQRANRGAGATALRRVRRSPRPPLFLSRAASPRRLPRRARLLQQAQGRDPVIRRRTPSRTSCRAS